MKISYIVNSPSLQSQATKCYPSGSLTFTPFIMSTGLDNLNKDPRYISAETKGLHQRVILGNLESAINGTSMEDIEKWLGVVNKYIDRVEMGNANGDKEYMVQVLTEIRKILLPAMPVYGVLDTISKIDEAICLLENPNHELES